MVKTVEIKFTVFCVSLTFFHHIFAIFILLSRCFLSLTVLFRLLGYPLFLPNFFLPFLFCEKCAAYRSVNLAPMPSGNKKLASIIRQVFRYSKYQNVTLIILNQWQNLLYSGSKILFIPLWFCFTTNVIFYFRKFVFSRCPFSYLLQHCVYYLIIFNISANILRYYFKYGYCKQKFRFIIV